MFKTLTTAAVIMSTAASAYAAELQFSSQARVVDVTPVYRTVTTFDPVQVCEEREVKRTRYETRTRTVTTEGGKGNAGDALAGAVVGGIIGKGATGNDKGAAVGAIIGAIVAGENSKKGGTVTREVTERVPVTYYATETVCSTVNDPQSAINALERKIAQTERWINSGNVSLIKQAQVRVGVTGDGIVGPATRRAVTRYIWTLEDQILELRNSGGSGSTRVVDYYKVAARYEGQRFFYVSETPVSVGDNVSVTITVDVN